MSATCKMERSILIASIVSHLIDDAGARFLKPLKKGYGEGYIELEEPQAREKVAHALRDAAVAKSRTTVTEWSKMQNNRQVSLDLDKKNGSLPSLVSSTSESVVPLLSWSQLRQDMQQNDCMAQRQKQESNQDFILQLQRKKLMSMLAEENPFSLTPTATSCTNNNQGDTFMAESVPDLSFLMTNGIGDGGDCLFGTSISMPTRIGSSTFAT